MITEDSMAGILSELYHVPLNRLPKVKAILDSWLMARETGRLGGRLGAKKRWEGISAEERSAGASRAAKARWARKG